MSTAAKALNVPTRDLRLLTYAVPELIDAALEVEEEMVDEAQALLFKAMRVGDMRRRIRAAGLFLRATAAGPAAWLRLGAVGQSLEGAGDVTLKWLDS